MIGYSAAEVFSTEHQALRQRAEVGVALLPEIDGLRCHEVSRALGKWLNLDAVDGRYGAVEHSWLRLPARRIEDRGHILDVYAVGRLPLVQLVDTTFFPQCLYEASSPRIDIDETLVLRLLETLLRSGGDA